MKTLSGLTVVLGIDSLEFAVSSLKKLIEGETGIKTGKQLLTFGSHQLQDQLHLSNYNMQKESTLHLTVPLRGGMPKLVYTSSDEMDDDFEGNDEMQRPKKISKPTVDNTDVEDTTLLERESLSQREPQESIPPPVPEQLEVEHNER